MLAPTGRCIDGPAQGRPQRGGLGQWSEISYRGHGAWSVSALVDRTRYPAQGLEGGRPGVAGEVILSDGTRPQPAEAVGIDLGGSRQHGCGLRPVAGLDQTLAGPEQPQTLESRISATIRQRLRGLERFGRGAANHQRVDQTSASLLRARRRIQRLG